MSLKFDGFTLAGLILLAHVKARLRTTTSTASIFLSNCSKCEKRRNTNWRIIESVEQICPKSGGQIEAWPNQACNTWWRNRNVCLPKKKPCDYKTSYGPCKAWRSFYRFSSLNGWKRSPSMLLLLTCKTIIATSKHSFSYNYLNFFILQKISLWKHSSSFTWPDRHLAMVITPSRFIMQVRYNQSTLFGQQRTIMIINVL